MAMDARTVRRWLDEPEFRARATPARPSKLDPYKAYIRRLLEHHPYSAAQILNRLREAGYVGGASRLPPARASGACPRSPTSPQASAPAPARSRSATPDAA